MDPQDQPESSKVPESSTPPAIPPAPPPAEPPVVLAPESMVTPESSQPPEPPVPLPRTSQPPAPPPAPQPPAPEPPLPAPNPKTRAPNILPVSEPGERTVCVIRRHPIGILGVYVMCGLVLVITAALAFFVAPGIAGNGRQAVLGGTLVFVIVAAVCVAFALIAAKVYWGNSWTVTTDSLTQVRQFNLFTRQSSQLSLKDLEDVTTEQNGVLAEMFNYGVLQVETAAETSKFIFPFCPNPNYYAQRILEAREVFEQNSRAGEPH